MISCANIIAAEEKLVVCRKALPTYIEGDAMYIEFNTGHPDMVGKWKLGGIGVHGGVTSGVAKVKRIKKSEYFKQKSVKIL